MIWSGPPTLAFMPPSRQDEIKSVLPGRHVALPAAASGLDIQPVAAHLVLQAFHFVLQFFLVLLELFLKLRL